MRRVFSILVLMIFAVTVVLAKNYKVVSGVQLNVRDSATSNADIIGTLAEGMEIDVISIKKDWAEINYNGSHGYVMVRYLEPLAGKDINGKREDTHAEADHTVIANSLESKTAEVDDFESQRKGGFFEITYSARSFDYVKESGSYGISWTVLPYEIAPRLYAGLHFSPFNFNFGLSDYTCDEVRLGPAIGFYFTPKTFVSMPLDVFCNVYFDDDSKTSTAWGMSLAPSVYLGDKGGVFIGPQFSIGFSGGSKVVCGFRAGIYF